MSRGSRRTDEQMLEDYYNIWKERGEPPTATVLNQEAVEGRCVTAMTYQTHFGGLTETRRRVIEIYGDPTGGSEEEEQESEPEENEEVGEENPDPEEEAPETASPVSRSKDDDLLLEELRDEWLRQGRPPTSRSTRESDAISDAAVYQRHFGSWVMALCKVARRFGAEYDLPGWEEYLENNLEKATAALAAKGQPVEEGKTESRSGDRIINLMPCSVRLIGSYAGPGVGDPFCELPPEGRVIVDRSRSNFFTEDGMVDLCDQYGVMPDVFVVHCNKLRLEQDGEIIDFPEPEANVFYIVEREIIIAAILAGRSIEDLFYPVVSAERSTYIHLDAKGECYDVVELCALENPYESSIEE